MNLLRQGRWAWALCAAGQLAVFPLFAGAASGGALPAKLPLAPTNAFPTSPSESSPVVLFRQLLAMRPAEREIFLTNRPPEIRKRILVKVNEYEALDPNTRELRLRATELRWHLMPLLREPPTDRAARLAQVPDDISGIGRRPSQPVDYFAAAVAAGIFGERTHTALLRQRGCERQPA